MHTPTYRHTNIQVAFVYFRGIYLYPPTIVRAHPATSFVYEANQTPSLPEPVRFETTS
jgi:hypothetical protein